MLTHGVASRWTTTVWRLGQSFLHASNQRVACLGRRIGERIARIVG